MNRSYRSVWNDKTGMFVAVSESGKSDGSKLSPGANAVALAPGLSAVLESATTGKFRRNMILLNMPMADLPEYTSSRSERHSARV